MANTKSAKAVTNKNPKNIVLGKGVFKIDDVMVGLTRDGGKFSVEFENRQISADGDRGPVKGRITRDAATPKLEINHLEVLTSLTKLHPGTKEDNSSEPGYTIVKGTGKIDDESDYHSVEFNGETKDGREISIKVENAINLENIEWDLKDKDEVIDKVTFTGTYEENAEDEYDEGWEIKYKSEE